MSNLNADAGSRERFSLGRFVGAIAVGAVVFSIAIYVQGTTTITTNITTDGLVGISSSTPSYLSVDASTTSPLVVFDQDGAGDILRLLDGGSAVVVIENGGDFGIGSTTPLAKLTIQNTGANESLIVEDVADDTSPFVVDTSGNVGIGDISPDFKLESVGATGSGYFGITNSTDGDILTIDGAGAVGIASSTPSGLLGIDASTTSPLVVFDQDGAGDILRLLDAGIIRFVVEDGGDVGIGSTTPDAPLSIESSSGTTTVSVGSATKPSGLQMYSGDGTAYCVYVGNGAGALSVVAGSCTTDPN